MRDFLYFLKEYHPWALQVWFFGFGACVGSFLNVCILRIPAGQSIVTPRSRCACGKPIAWYDNIPILSWFILRGRARCCGRRFSIRYATIEAATGAVFLILWRSLPPAVALAGMVFFALLLLGAMIDIDHLILPDITTIGGMFIGLLFCCFWPQIQGVAPTPELWMIGGFRAAVFSIIGIVVGAGVVFWLRELGEFFLKKEAMGYGDVLLMGCIGAFCGWQGAVFALFGGGVLGCVVVVPWKLFAWAFRKPAVESAPELAVEPAPAPVSAEATPNAASGEAATTPTDPQVFGVEIPFGPWLALAGFLYYACPQLHEAVNNYFLQIHAIIFEMSPGN
jgi:leader peptidase (prepilin peptidase) / N-methyltransferase